MRPFDALQVKLTGTNLVEASAGTGKTYAISTLFVRLLLERQLEVEEILVVTFTEAATAELRDRLRKRLRETLEVIEALEHRTEVTGPAADLAKVVRAQGTLEHAKRRVLTAIADFDRAQISTIHGFCQRALQDAAFESGVLFDAELVQDLRPLIDETILDFWALHNQSASPVFLRYLKSRSFGPSAARSLAKQVLQSHDIRLLPERDAAAEPTVERFRTAFGAMAEIWSEETVLSELQRAPLNRSRYRKDHVGKWVAQVDAYVRGGHPELPSLPERFEKLTPPAIQAAAKGPFTMHAVFQACGDVYDAYAAFTDAMEERLIQFKRELLHYVSTEVPRRKRQSGVLGFDDLLFLLYQALQSKNGMHLAASLRKQFPAALIDEFQDTDPVQYGIFASVYKTASSGLFLIGDPKQAIYSFRGADVFAYMSAVTHTKAERRFTMRRNYRSDEKLVDAVGKLFTRPKFPFLLESITYPDVRANQHGESELRLPSDLDSAPLQLLFVRQAGEDKPGSSDLGADWTSRQLPVLIAGEIARLLTCGAMLGERELTSGDIAVLTRTNAQAFEVQDALRQVNVPSVVLGDKSIYETEEAQELQRVLSAVFEPQRVDLIRAAMTTHLLGISAQEMLDVERDADRWDQWLQDFRDWNDIWTRQGFIQMFRSLTQRRRIQARLLSEKGGERRLTNLLQLAELLHTAARRSHLGPAGLLHYLATERAAQVYRSDEEQIRLESDSRAVKITTVHKSKGLQYPIVLCPHLWNGMLIHKNDEGCVVFHDPSDENRVKLDLEIPSEHVAQQEWEKFAENLRLLYVALTRAQHRCYVVWGRISSYRTSPLALLLHPPANSGALVPTVEEIKAHLKELSDAAMLAELTRLDEAGVLHVEALPAAVELPAPVETRRDTEVKLAERVAPPLPPLDFRVGSFSALAAHDDAPSTQPVDLPDRDELATVPLPSATERPALDEQLSQAAHLQEFPRGARAGNFFHDVLEHCDFSSTDAAALDALVQATLLTYGYDPKRWSPAVCGALNLILATPLVGGAANLRLADLTPRHRLNELEFHVPVSGGTVSPPVAARDIAQVFEKHGSKEVPARYAAQLRQLTFSPLRGFLKGYIDMVFLHERRWYVVDYKSNHLGDTLGHYTADNIAAAMSHSHYYLQYHLYAVALHRYLAFRQPGYDYDQHFGGVFYLFLKGMSPDTAGTSGVYFERPPLARLQALSDLLAHGAAPSGRAST